MVFNLYTINEFISSPQDIAVAFLSLSPVQDLLDYSQFILDNKYVVISRGIFYTFFDIHSIPGSFFKACIDHLTKKIWRSTYNPEFISFQSFEISNNYYNIISNSKPFNNFIESCKNSLAANKNNKNPIPFSNLPLSPLGRFNANSLTFPFNTHTKIKQILLNEMYLKKLVSSYKRDLILNRNEINFVYLINYKAQCKFHLIHPLEKKYTKQIEKLEFKIMSCREYSLPYDCYREKMLYSTYLKKKEEVEIKKSLLISQLVDAQKNKIIARRNCDKLHLELVERHERLSRLRDENIILKKKYQDLLEFVDKVRN